MLKRHFHSTLLKSTNREIEVMINNLNDINKKKSIYKKK